MSFNGSNLPEQKSSEKISRWRRKNLTQQKKNRHQQYNRMFTSPLTISIYIVAGRCQFLWYTNIQPFFQFPRNKSNKTIPERKMKRSEKQNYQHSSTGQLRSRRKKERFPLSKRFVSIHNFGNKYIKWREKNSKKEGGKTGQNSRAGKSPDHGKELFPLEWETKSVWFITFRAMFVYAERKYLHAWDILLLSIISSEQLQQKQMNEKNERKKKNQQKNEPQ